jgi:hypothetical protein
MLSGKNLPIVRNWRLRRIARLVRQGIVPKGVPQAEIFEALRLTRPRGAVEMFGFLSMKVFRPDGTLREDLGLQSVRKVTTAFTKFLADGFCTSGSAALLDDFIYHGCGDGSTAEASGDVALVSSKGTRVTGSQTHGTSSNIFKTVRTFVASVAFTAIEHGIFNTMSGGELLDRSLVTTPPTVATGDEIEFTYNLTINSET